MTRSSRDTFSATAYLLAWAATLLDQFGRLPAAGDLAGIAILVFLILEFPRQRRYAQILFLALTGIGLPYNVTQDSVSAWITIVVIDVWHWTPLVILLSYAGLRAIPDAYYQAARIDGASRWAVFVNIELPKLQKVLVIAVLLRFMQTFMIYTEPVVVTGGGPGSATTFLSIDLVKIAIGQVDVGSAAAMSLVYYLIILTACWIFFTVMTQLDRRRDA